MSDNTRKDNPPSNFSWQTTTNPSGGTTQWHRTADSSVVVRTDDRETQANLDALRRRLNGGS
jgi:hypothetical protein